MIRWHRSSTHCGWCWPSSWVAFSVFTKRSTLEWPDETPDDADWGDLAA